MKITNVMFSKTFILLLLLTFGCAGNNPQEPDDGRIDENLPEFVEYQAIIALQQPTHGNLLLSGGGSGVRTTTTSIGIDESWIIVNAEDPSKIGEPVRYGDRIALQRTSSNPQFLSGGGSGVRTTTTSIGIDEIWQIIHSGE